MKTILNIQAVSALPAKLQSIHSMLNFMEKHIAQNVASCYMMQILGTQLLNIKKMEAERKQREKT